MTAIPSPLLLILAALLALLPENQPARAAENPPPYYFTTLAGQATRGSADGTGATARFCEPTGAVVDATGNVYVADTFNHTIRRITAGGLVTTFAGAVGQAGSADGVGTAARFNRPAGITLDGSGNLFVADTANHLIRKIAPDGAVTTLAGSAGLAGSADGTGSSARFNSPAGLAVGSAGDLFVADIQNQVIRRVTPAGVVSTFAGLAGVTGFDDGTGSSARFVNPSDVAVDAAGNVYVADSGNATVRKITPAGAVTTLAGSHGHVGSADGPGGSARFWFPRGIAVDAAGNLLVADIFNCTLRRITPDGTVSTLAGQAGDIGWADGTTATARFGYLTGVTLDLAGNVYAVDQWNNSIRKVTPAGVVTTLAGTGDSIGSADGAGLGARFYRPAGIAVDGAGNVYVADQFNSTIRKITPAGVVSTLAGLAGSTGLVNGTGSAARFDYPFGLAVDAAGNVFVSEPNRHVIRKTTAAGVVTTFAGADGRRGSADGPADAARFDYPWGLAIDGAGNLFVADQSNATIRRITPAGVVTTFAGSPVALGSADGPAGTARFAGPQGVAVDKAGNVFVADTNNSTIRRITPDGRRHHARGPRQQQWHRRRHGGGGALRPPGQRGGGRCRQCLRGRHAQPHLPAHHARGRRHHPRRLGRACRLRQRRAGRCRPVFLPGQRRVEQLGVRLPG